jgi:hypothetical protein
MLLYLRQQNAMPLYRWRADGTPMVLAALKSPFVLAHVDATTGANVAERPAVSAAALTVPVVLVFAGPLVHHGRLHGFIGSGFEYKDHTQRYSHSSRALVSFRRRAEGTRPAAVHGRGATTQLAVCSGVPTHLKLVVLHQHCCFQRAVASA